MKLLSSLLFATILCTACDKDEEESKPTLLPTNLQIAVNVASDGSGKVDVTATAENATFYRIYFGEDNPDTPVESADGTESHTYKATGSYTVVVEAYSTPSDLIRATRVIDVELPLTDVGYQSPETREGYNLTWSDEFEGSQLGSDWTPEIGAGGWGNNEWQYYRAENTNVAGGYLTITAKKENFSGSSYTSSRLITKGKKEFQYGRVDIRAKLPKGQGIWPALWMLGANISTVSWPACGEIDIMEMIGGNNREKTVHGTVHWSNEANAHAQYGGSKTLATGTYSDKFYVYSIEWDANSIKWFIDDVKYHEIDITPSHLSEFRAPHFFIFNIAVGGNWPGYPDATTTFPQQMYVDYIRVFQKP
jgi:beta-glucanase (GH16 family)